MPPLTDYLSRRGEILVLILVIVLSVGLIMLSSGAKDSTVRAMNDAAMTPIQSLLTGVTGLSGVRAENDSLRAQLARSSLEMAELRERTVSTSRLESLLGFRERSRFLVVAARVVARETGRVDPDLKIDKGSLDGVRKNLAVVTTDGLVGKVTQVEPHSAYIRPLTGRHCRVSARVTRTRTEGILEWMPGRGLHLTFLPFRAEVEPGDDVVSSGLGGVFPRGIAIGTVESVDSDPADGSRRVSVSPALDFGSIEEVFVVIAERAEEDLPAEGEDAPAAPESTGA